MPSLFHAVLLAAPQVPMPTVPQALLLFAAGLLGGAINAVAGGGSFVTFPVMIFTGVPAINANASSTVALWPGSAASVGAYRNELRSAENVALLAVVSLLGGVLGAVLLLRTPSVTFERLIPYLLLMATLLFTFSGTLSSEVRKRTQGRKLSRGRMLTAIGIIQFVIALYGGFFGGGIGILMLATLSLMGLENIHRMNAVKTVLATSINGIAVLTFVIARAVIWPQTLVMLAGAVVGGYSGAHFAQKIKPATVRRGVIAIGFALTLYFFFARH